MIIMIAMMIHDNDVDEDVLYNFGYHDNTN